MKRLMCDGAGTTTANTFIATLTKPSESSSAVALSAPDGAGTILVVPPGRALSHGTPALKQGRR
jgi:hypothetical protein